MTEVDRVFTRPKVCGRPDMYTSVNSGSPSRDSASRMLRQAVARSAMDCHSSSVESVVSERTERDERTEETREDMKTAELL